jgi:hypothetical protein
MFALYSHARVQLNLLSFRCKAVLDVFVLILSVYSFIYAIVAAMLGVGIFMCA